MPGAYAEFQPRHELRPWVRLIWTYADPSPSDVVQRIAPDGCPELILHLGSPYEEQGEDGAWVRQPRVLFAGQMTKPLCLRAAGPVSCVALRFEPDGAAHWFGQAMEAATDRRLDVSGRIAVPDGLDADAAREVLENAVTVPLMVSAWPLDREVRAEVTRLAEGGEADRDASDQRRMQRLFETKVGVPPRMLQSVFRFRKVFDHAQLEGATWIDSALAAGYFDQPQMARDFQRFLGCPATQWAREQVELARSMSLPRG